MIAGPPELPAAVPVAVRSLAGEDQVRAVWRNELGGLTFEVAGFPRYFIKWSPVASGLDLAPEVERMRWAGGFTTVPTILGTGRDTDGQWLATAALPGSSAVAPRWTADPNGAVVGLGRGLRRFHDALPVNSCPFDWSAQRRFADAECRARSGQLAVTDWPAAYPNLSVEAALRLAGDPPSIDRLVVCHGDACAPNTLLHDDGSLAGHVDLGSLGVADRWADLAVVTWSTEWNYGADWTDVLLDAYGVPRDQDRLDYYRLLWSLDP